MYSAMQIVHYIIDLCNRVGRPVSNLEIQKILYFLQVYYMRVHDGAALFTDDIYAWTYGPVVPEVYYTYNGYGGSIIRNSYDVSDIAENDSRDLRDVILRLKQKGPWNYLHQIQSVLIRLLRYCSKSATDWNMKRCVRSLIMHV